MTVGSFHIRFKRSWLGLSIGTLFFIAGLAALAFHLFSVSTNTGDSGLSGLYLYFLTRPWFDLIPETITYSFWWAWVVYPVSIFFVSLNGFLLYCLFGGLKISKK